MACCAFKAGKCRSTLFFAANGVGMLLHTDRHSKLKYYAIWPQNPTQIKAWLPCSRQALSPLLLLEHSPMSRNGSVTHYCWMNAHLRQNAASAATLSKVRWQATSLHSVMRIHKTEDKDNGWDQPGVACMVTFRGEKTSELGMKESAHGSRSHQLVSIRNKNASYLRSVA